jgi:hypothetical protein
MRNEIIFDANTIPQTFADQRHSLRRRLKCPAWVDAGNGVLDCTVWDMSEDGVRIAVGQPEGVPEEFVLLLTVDGAVRRHCAVVWRSEGQVGARYVADR